jgi:hypothetical protein
MSGKSGAGAVRPTSLSKESPSPVASPELSLVERKSNSGKKPTAVVKNQKEVVIEIAALKGKGYPSPVAFDTGNGKTRATLPSLPKRGKQP